jgi:hypothetical protein
LDILNSPCIKSSSGVEDHLSGRCSIKTYICPSDPGNSTSQPGYTSYAANALVFGGCTVTGGGTMGSVAPSASVSAFGGARYPASLPDGTSNTIMWTDMLAQCGSGAAPSTHYSSYSSSSSAGTWTNVLGSTETNPPFVGYTKPPASALFYANLNQNTCSANGVGQATSAHTAVVLAGLGDGRVRNLSTGLTSYSYNLALIPNDGWPMGSDW